MTLFDNLQFHKGALLRLKTQLFWHGGRGWDKNPGRICLILGAADTTVGGGVVVLAAGAAACAARRVAAHLLIDGSPQGVWVTEEDVEVIDEAW